MPSSPIIYYRMSNKRNHFFMQITISNMKKTQRQLTLGAVVVTVGISCLGFASLSYAEPLEQNSEQILEQTKEKHVEEGAEQIIEEKADNVQVTVQKPAQEVVNPVAITAERTQNKVVESKYVINPLFDSEAEDSEKPPKPPRFYFGGGFSSSTLEPNIGDSNYDLDDPSAFGFNALAGRYFLKNYSAEMQLWHLGDATLSFSGGSPETVTYNGFGARGMYFYPKSDNFWSVYGGLGASFLDTSSDVSIIQKDSFSPWLGAGLQVRITKKIDGRLAIDSFSKDASQVTFQAAYRWLKKKKPKPKPITAEQKSIDEMIEQIQKESEQQEIGDIGDETQEEEQSLLLQDNKTAVTETTDNLIEKLRTVAPTRSTLSRNDDYIARSEAAEQAQHIQSRMKKSDKQVLAYVPKAEKYEPKNADLSVFYNLGSYTLNSKSRQSLKQIGKRLQAEPDTVVVIVGHTCDIGSQQLNDKLSVLRAMAVQQYLIANDIAPERTRTTGYGLDKPKFDNENIHSKSQNRRVDLFIEQPSQTDKARVIQ